MNESKPSQSDISPTPGSTLEEAKALEIFLGLSQDDALKLFQENSAHYLPYLMWMGIGGFSYYLRPAVIYIESEQSELDAIAVAMIYGNISFQASQNRDIVPKCKDWIQRFCNYVLTNWDKFDISDEINPGLRDNVAKLLEQAAEA